MNFGVMSDVDGQVFLENKYFHGGGGRVSLRASAERKDKCFLGGGVGRKVFSPWFNDEGGSLGV